MAAEAIFRHGEPMGYMDYLATADIAAGQVVLIGNTAGLTCAVAHLPIANGATGALAIGGGIYDVTMLTNMAPGAKAYWDDTNNKVTSTSTNNALFGFLVEGNTGANAVVECVHMPFI
jgi:predicted RecA/RadA family phage recombinase